MPQDEQKQNEDQKPEETSTQPEAMPDTTSEPQEEGAPEEPEALCDTSVPASEAEVRGEASREEEGQPESEEPQPELVLPEEGAVVVEGQEEFEVEALEEPGAPAESASVEEAAEKKARATKVIKPKKIVGLPDEDEAEMRWYVIHAHSGHENKVRESLENRVKQEHLEHLVNKVLVPTEEVAEVKGGKKRVTSRKIFPGYVLTEMKLTHKTWYLIRTTSGVTGFIGSGKMPTPLEPEEVEAIFAQMRGEQKKPKPKVSFEKDEKVKIIEGPFTNFMGYVDEVNPERGKLKVMVEIFERLTSVELEFWQVEKV